MNRDANVLDYLRGVFEVIKDTLLDFKWLKPCLIIVFGSAARPEDFVIGVSDIDVLVLTWEEPSRRHYKFTVYNSIVNVIVFRVEEFRKLVEHGDPLTFMLKNYVLLYNTCPFILKLKPKITDHTRYVLRRSIFAALGLSLESYYFLENYKKTLSHLYHSLRHLIRYKASQSGKLPISDREICEYSEKPLRDLYTMLSNFRRKEAKKNDVKKLMVKVIKVIAEELNLKATSLEYLEKQIKGNILLVTAGELNGYIAFKVEMFQKGKRKVLEIKNSKSREVNSIFFNFNHEKTKT